MARWKLTAPHYLSVPDTEWEFVETDTGSGKQVRHRYVVPMYLDPKDPSDCNRQGEIVVCWKNKGAQGDLVFVGEPTPEIEPLDDEAREISDSHRHKWSQYGGGFQGAGYAEGMLQDFQRQLSEASRRNPPAIDHSGEIAELKDQVAELVKQNAELLRKVARRA